MGSSVCNAVVIVIMRKIVIGGIQTTLIHAEGELTYLHARKAQAISKALNLRRDDSKVFGDDRQTFGKTVEQLGPRSLHPTSVYGVRGTRSEEHTSELQSPDHLV